MSLIWHIVRKDLFRLRWILLLWALVLAGSMAMAVIQSALDLETYFPLHVAALVGVTGFGNVIAFGLVMGVMHDDPVADGEAFWITRPISGGQLLVAKATVMTILWLLPLLVLAPFWLRHGYDLGQMGGAAWATFRLHLTIMVVALPFAVLSANASRFVMSLLIAGGILGTLAILYRLGDNGRPDPVAAGLEFTRLRLVMALWAGTAGVVTLIQFLRRRTRVSLAITGVAAAMGFALMKWWPVNLHPAEPASAGVATPVLALDSATLEQDRSGNAAGEQAVWVAFKVDGLPERTVAHAKAASHRLQWPDGAVVEGVPAVDLDDLAQAAWRHALGEKTVGMVRTKFGLANPIQQRLLRDSPAYSTSIGGDLRKLEVVAEVPVIVGAKNFRRGDGLRVVSHLWDIATGELAIAHSETAPAADTAPAFYFLINRQDGRSIMGRSARVGMPLDAGAIHFSHVKVGFGLGRNWKGGTPEDVSAWVKNAVLVKVVAREAGTFRSTAAVPSLKVEATGPSPRTTARNRP